MSMEWIKVTLETMPPTHGMYLVHVKGSETSFVALWSSEDGFLPISYPVDVFTKPITHWAYMPEPPKEE